MSKARIGAAHIIVGAAGVILLVWTALPLNWNGLVETNTERGWLLVIGWAVLCGVIGGLLEGVAVRNGFPRTALALLLVAAFFGSWMPFFALGRWFDEQDYVMESANLFQPIAGWLLFVAVITAVALLIARHRRVSGIVSN